MAVHAAFVPGEPAVSSQLPMERDRAASRPTGDISTRDSPSSDVTLAAAGLP